MLLGATLTHSALLWATLGYSGLLWATLGYSGLLARLILTLGARYKDALWLKMFLFIYKSDLPKKKNLPRKILDNSKGFKIEIPVYRIRTLLGEFRMRA